MIHITNRKMSFWGLITLMIMACMVVLAESCHKEPEIIIDSDAKRAFLESEIIGFYSADDTFLFNKAQHQTSKNYIRNSFRIQNDDQSEYLHIKMETIPKSIGVKVIINYSMYRGDEIISFIQMFECSKISGGYFWFWSNVDKIGIIIPWK